MTAQQNFQICADFLEMPEGAEQCFLNQMNPRVQQGLSGDGSEGPDYLVAQS